MAYQWGDFSHHAYAPTMAKGVITPFYKNVEHDKNSDSMSLTLGERKTLAQLEFEKADAIMSQIELFHQNNSWDTIANHLYYAVYHAVLALFLHDGIEVGTHKTTINRLGNYHVMTGIYHITRRKTLFRLKSIREVYIGQAYLSLLQWLRTLNFESLILLRIVIQTPINVPSGVKKVPLTWSYNVTTSVSSLLTGMKSFINVSPS